MRHYTRLAICVLSMTTVFCGWAKAQGLTGGGAFPAAAFESWSIGARGPVPGPGVGTLVLDSTEATSTDGITFHPILAGRTLRISDGTSSESVTVSAVQCPASGSTCIMTATFAMAHPGRIQIMSGSDGLQEAADAASAQGGYVLVDADWHGNSTDFQHVIQPSNVLMEDNRSGHLQIYSASSQGIPTPQLTINANGITAESIASVRIVAPGSTSDADNLQQAIAGCPSSGCTIYLQSGIFTLTHTVQFDRPVHLVGTGVTNTVIQANSALQSILDPIDYTSVAQASNYWTSAGSTLQVFTSMTESGAVSQGTPFPAKGTSGLSVITGSSGTNSLVRTFAPTADIASDSRLGFWLSAGRSGSSAITVEIDDGTQADCWSVSPPAVYNQWRFVSLDLRNPTATGTSCTGPADGPHADLNQLAHFRLYGLQPSTRYSIDELGAWSADFNLFTITSPNVEIDNLSLVHIDMNDGSAVYTNSPTTSLRQLSIQGGANSIYGDTAADHLDVDHVLSEAAGNVGISILATNGIVQNSEVVGAAAGGVVVGNHASYTSILHNQVTNVSADGIDLQAPRGGLVINNQILNVETFGILVYGSMQSLVRGNTIQNANEAGIQLQNDCSGTLIAGNAVFNTGKNAIDTNSGGVMIRGNLVDTTGSSSGFPTSESTCVNVLPQSGNGPVQVSGNTCRNLGGAGALNAFGIWIQGPAPQSTIDGNTVVSPGAGGIQISTAPQGSGQNPSPITNIDVRDNTVDLNGESGAFGIALSNCLKCSVSDNRVSNPAPDAPPLLAVHYQSQDTQIFGNLLDRAGVTGIVGLSLDNDTANAFVGSGNTITAGDGSTPAVQDSGTSTKYGFSDTGSGAEMLSPFITNGVPAFNSPAGSVPFTVISTTPVPLLSLAGGVGTSVSTAQLQVGGDVAVSSNARMAWSAFVAGALTQGRQINQWTPDRAVVALRLEAVLGTAPSGCTSQPVLTLAQGASTLKLPLTAVANDSGSQTLNFSAGTPIQLSYSTGAGCTQVAADLDATVSFRME